MSPTEVDPATKEEIFLSYIDWAHHVSCPFNFYLFLLWYFQHVFPSWLWHSTPLCSGYVNKVLKVCFPIFIMICFLIRTFNIHRNIDSGKHLGIGRKIVPTSIKTPKVGKHLPSLCLKLIYACFYPLFSFPGILY